MRTKESKTRVVFRVFNDGEVIALFPHIKERKGMIESYMHIGQHGSASPLIVNDTRPAAPEQYRELLNELVCVGYNPVIGTRLTKCPQSYNERKEAARNEAIDWEDWKAGRNLSYGEFAEWGNYFENLGRRYGLLREFRENGII